MKVIGLFLLGVLTLFVAGCSKNVSAVKGASHPGYPTVKIGDAYQAAMNGASWSETKTEKGQIIVQVKGELKEKYRDSIVKNTSPKDMESLKNSKLSVTAKFTMRADGKSFDFGGVTADIQDGPLKGKDMTLNVDRWYYTIME
ncbi:MAG TPA: hypothetical protein DET40_21630 [Lentisphaeria bacterium]|nr:hypothetical protein [Lentisphaeria bacterium]